MKNSIKFSLIFILILSNFSFSQLEVVSKVKEATLFSNQAQITREKIVKLNKGENILKYSGLENSINNNSVQISGTNGITIISNRIKMDNASLSSQSSEVRAVLDSITILNRMIQLKSKNIQNLEAEKNMILYNKSANGVNSGFNLDNMIDMAEYYRNNLGKIDELVYDENQKLRKVREQSRLLNEKLKNLGYRNRSNSIYVTVYSDRAQSASLKLVYLVNGIGWTPFYEIKSKGMGSKINAICKASIFQNSQVDWKNVNLTISTSNPMSYGTMPTIHPWVLRFQDANRKFKSQAVNKNGNGYMNEQPVSNRAYKVAEEKYNSGSLSNFTTATDHMINREFDISLPYSIKGINGKAVIEIENYDFDVSYVYYSAPKYNCNVFLIAHIKDWQKHNLLPGTANLFLEGTFVGTTMINPNEISDTMSLVLGKDEGIVVKREKIKDLSSREALGGKRKVDMGIQITVKNNKGKEIELVLEDQVPITSDEKIEITIKDISGASKSEETGKLNWKMTLKAGEKQVKSIKYEVKYPKNKTINNF